MFLLFYINPLNVTILSETIMTITGMSSSIHNFVHMGASLFRDGSTVSTQSIHNHYGHTILAHLFFQGIKDGRRGCISPSICLLKSNMDSGPL